MPARHGEISPRRAAKLLEVNPVTVRRWCFRALNGETVVVSAVRRDAAGRYWLSKAEVLGVAVRASSGEILS